MLFFLDTEFIDNGKTIEAISIGIVNDKGDEFYVEVDFDEAKAKRNPFLRSHVLPHLEVKPENRLPWLDVAEQLQKWVEGNAANAAIEFWAYHSTYDWVLIAQLFGPMVALPPRFPRLCFDLEQHWRLLGCPHVKPPPPKNQHHALADARWNKQFYEALLPYDKAITRGLYRG